VGLIWRHTFYPYKLYLPLPGEDFSRLETAMPNIVQVPVESSSTQLQRIDRILADCEGQYVAVVPSGLGIRDMWLEDSLYALLNTAKENEAFELPNLSLRDGLKAAGINVRRIRPDEIPFQFDSLLEEAQNEEKAGNWRQAAEVYGYIGEHYKNKMWMKALAANALFKAGDMDASAELVSGINQNSPTVATLLLEAKLKRRQKDLKSASDLLRKAEDVFIDSDIECVKAQHSKIA
jgi:hypothetical protein